MSGLRLVLPFLALFSLSDAHWGLMQLATWFEMTADSISKHEPLMDSIFQTVTGEKKCPHCRQIEKERERENDSAVQFESKTLGLNFWEKGGIFPPPALYEFVNFEHEFGITRRDAPLSPPPWS